MTSAIPVERPVIDPALIEAAGRLDFLELAGRIIADPHRVQVSTAGTWLLANTVEVLWQTCLSADAMVTELSRISLLPPGDQAASRTKFIKHATQVERRMDVLLGRRKEI